MAEEKPRVLQTKKDFDNFLFDTPYFAFLDILGFSTLVQQNPHEVLVDVYKNIFGQTIVKVDEMMGKIAASRAKKMGENYTPSGLRIINISDSILIWTEHGQPTAIFEMVLAVSTLLSISLLQGLPLRGCITRQKFTVLEQKSVTSIIGRALVHAYGQEKIQQWSGCIIDDEIIRYFHSIEKYLRGWERPSELERSDMVVQYDIPIFDEKEKKITTKKGFAINWSEPGIKDEMIVTAFDAHNKKDNREGSMTPIKIKNTADFHNFCLQKKKNQAAALEALIKAIEGSA